MEKTERSLAAANAAVVTLTGHVVSFAQKQAPITAVRRINGVRAIAEEIEVRYPFEKKFAADKIAKRALDILGWDSVVPLARSRWLFEMAG